MINIFRKIAGFWRVSIKLRYLFLTAFVIAAAFITQEYSGYLLRKPEYEFNWAYICGLFGSNYFVWILFAPIMYRVAENLTNRGFKSIRTLLYALIGAVVALAHRVLTAISVAGVYYIFMGEVINPFGGHSMQSILLNWFSSLLEFGIIVGIFIAIGYYRKFRDKQNELNNAQLNALRMQLHPHFLFNTLHTISSLMGKNDEGQRVISRLGHLLRSMLEQNQKHTITLENELEYIRSYLDIEEVRFHDRLKVEYEIDQDSRQAMVPNLILQPLVENAIKHGFSKKADAGRIRISSKIDANQLELRVEDDGNGTGQSEESSARVIGQGIGISNVRERLKKMYGEHFKLDLFSPNGHGFVSQVRLPLRMQKGTE